MVGLVLPGLLTGLTICDGYIIVDRLVSVSGEVPNPLLRNKVSRSEVLEPLSGWGVDA